MSKKLFVVVREDRHRDDEITVHATRELANAAIEEFKNRYQHEDDLYNWAERNYGQPKWVRYVDVECCDDGPKARIEVTTLDGDL